MKVIIDTNSLLSLVRYYLPFDKENLLFNFIKEKIEIGQILFGLPAAECHEWGKGDVLYDVKTGFTKEK